MAILYALIQDFILNFRYPAFIFWLYFSKWKAKVLILHGAFVVYLVGNIFSSHQLFKTSFLFAYHV